MSEQSTPAEPVTLINVFEVPAEQVDEFIALWRDRAAIMSSQPGFRAAQLHRAISAESRFQLVNVAQWESQQACAAAMANPEFQAALRELAEQPGIRFSANPALYRGVVSLGGPQR